MSPLAQLVIDEQPANTVVVQGENVSVSTVETAVSVEYGLFGPQGIQGEPGIQGDPGAPGADALWNFTGAYSGGAAYAIGDVATYDGATWYRIDAHGGTVGDTPSEGAYWTELAAKGDQGIQGEPGDPALVILRGDIGDIPAASTEARLYFSEDEGKIYRDNGASWDEVTPTVAGIGAVGYGDFLFQKAAIYNALFGKADVNNNLGPAIVDTETTNVTRDFSTDPNDWTTLASFAGVTTWPDPTVLMNVLADFTRSDDGTAELEFRLLVDSVASDSATADIVDPYRPIALSFWEPIIEDGGSDIDLQWRRASGGSFAGTVSSNYRRIEIYTGYRPVYGDDARLTDDRTPTAHATSHEDGEADELELAATQITGTAVVRSDTVGLSAIFDGGTSAIAAASDLYVEVPFGATITGAKILADVSTTSVVDVQVGTFGGSFATICGGTKPSLSAATTSTTTITGWTTSVAAGSWLKLVVDSNSAAKRLVVALTFTRV